MSIAARLPGVIRDKLGAMDRQQRELAAVRGIGEFLILSSVAVGGCLFADNVWNLSPLVRTALLASLAVFVGLLVWFRVMRPVFRRRSWTDLAAAVEQQHPELTERLTTLVELQSESDRADSTLMHELLVRQTVKAVSNVDFTQVLPAGRSLQRAALGFAALATLLLPFLMPGGRYLLSWNRLLNPWGNYDWGSRLAFHVPDGDRVVPKGTDVTVQAELVGKQPSESSPMPATLRWIDGTGRSQQRPMTWNAEDQTYSWTIPRVDQSFRFRIASPRAVSREYRVTAADRPKVTSVSIEVQPPGYTGLPAESLDAVGAELRVAQHSQIRFRWQFAEPVSSAVLHWPASFPAEADSNSDDPSQQAEIRQTDVPLNLSEDRRSATVQLLATASGPFGVQLRNDLGLDSEEPNDELAIIPDEPPEITVQKDELLATARPDDVLPIATSAEDDYGPNNWRAVSMPKRGSSICRI
jgi:hypothetical protein